MNRSKRQYTTAPDPYPYDDTFRVDELESLRGDWTDTNRRTLYNGLTEDQATSVAAHYRAIDELTAPKDTNA